MADGIIFNLQRFSLHDGPGIRTTVFMKGCPLDCWWCHNPESIDPDPQLLFASWKCIGCESCLPGCPEGAISISDHKPVIDPVRCRRCFSCVERCPTAALEKAGRKVKVEELFTELCRDRVFFEESGGGVTFSGGEPLLQVRFLARIMELLKGEGIHTVIDTSGQAAWESIEKVLPWTDLFLYDIKILDQEKSRKYTGVSGELIRNNLECLLAAGSNLRVRIPVIPSINDTPENIAAIGQLLSSCGNPEVELLSYHSLGAAKAERLGKQYRLPGLKAPSKDKMMEIAAGLKKYGLTVTCEVDE